MAKKAKTTAITYIGPLGETMPAFGALEVGRHYQADPDLADYLVRAHPTHWRVPVTPEKESSDGRK